MVGLFSTSQFSQKCNQQPAASPVEIVAGCSFSDQKDTNSSVYQTVKNDDETDMTTAEFTFELIKVSLAVVAGLFAYFRFFREGNHKQRVQFDLTLDDLGLIGDERVVEIGVDLENKGNVEQRLFDIEVKIRSLSDGETLTELTGHEPRLEFPTLVHEARLTPKVAFFIRPKVKQRFPLVVRIPKDVSLLLVQSSFSYLGANSTHSAERAFRLRVSEKPVDRI